MLGGASTGAFSGCSKSNAARPVRISAACVYTNDTYIPGAGYYHAPFYAFYPRPFNDYNPVTKQYYFGGQWGAAPYQSEINISSPSSWAASVAESMRSDVSRGGFGSSGGGYGVWG